MFARVPPLNKIFFCYITNGTIISYEVWRFEYPSAAFDSSSWFGPIIPSYSRGLIFSYNKWRQIWIVYLWSTFYGISFRVNCRRSITWKGVLDILQSQFSFINIFQNVTLNLVCKYINGELITNICLPLFLIFLFITILLIF